ncbi:MAG: DMT family transporter [Candidatus Nanohaloarchaea archaeon]
MLWWYAALAGGIAFGLIYLIANHVMQEASSFDFAALFTVLAAVLYLPVAVATGSLTGAAFTTTALAALAASVTANVAAVIAINAAIKQGEVSLVTPLIRTQPVFTAVVGFALLGESLDPVKLGGIGLVTAGGYIVLLDGDTDMLEPVRTLRSDLAPQLALLSGFLLAVAAVSDRFATQTIGSTAYTFFLLTGMASAFLIYIALRSPDRFRSIQASFKRHTAAYLLVGVLSVVAYYSTVKALSLAAASRVIPIHQIQVLVGVVGGFLFFGERGVLRKLVGSTLLIAGVGLIV